MVSSPRKQVGLKLRPNLRPTGIIVRSVVLSSLSNHASNSGNVRPPNRCARGIRSPRFRGFLRVLPCGTRFPRVRSGRVFLRSERDRLNARGPRRRGRFPQIRTHHAARVFFLRTTGFSGPPGGYRGPFPSQHWPGRWSIDRSRRFFLRPVSAGSGVADDFFLDQCPERGEVEQLGSAFRLATVDPRG